MVQTRELSSDPPPLSGALDDGRQSDLVEIVFALSDALDLVGGDVIQHGKRVSHYGAEIGRRLRLSRHDLGDLFLASLLHDSGVSRQGIHRRLMANWDWEESPQHCFDGARLLAGYPPLERISDIVLYHHSHWSDAIRDLVDPDVFLLANIIFLSDRVDTAMARSAEPLLARHRIRDRIHAERGRMFAPRLVDAFLEVSEPEAFWLMVEGRHLDPRMDEIRRAIGTRPVSTDGLDHLARIFARVVDGKSTFTARHSEGVARVSRRLGELAGLHPDDLARIELAGLLHDLGKLRVPDEVLDKPGPLDRTQVAAIERHTFETWQILRRAGPLAEISEWAAFHHEALNGSGYPFHRREAEIPLPARIVAVADVFQALAQDRPYRAGLPTEQILGILHDMTTEGRLDPRLVSLSERHAAELHRLAEAPADETAEPVH